MKRKLPETFEVESGSLYKRQRTAYEYGTEDYINYSLLDPMPVASSVPLYFAESRFSPAFRTFQAFYNNSDYNAYEETVFYYQQQNYNDNYGTYESPRLEGEQYPSYNSVEYYTTIPNYSSRSSGRMQSLQNQNQVVRHSSFTERCAEDKESYRPIVVSQAYEVDSPLPSPTHTNTSDVSNPSQKKPLSKVPDPKVIKQLRELIDAQKIFQKDVSAKLGVRYGPTFLNLARIIFLIDV